MTGTWIPSVALAQVDAGQTVVLGFGTVFIGLICLIAIIWLMSALIRAFTGKKMVAPAAAEVSEAPLAAQDPKEREALVAAMAAAVATVMGKDVAGIRIVSLKKVQ